MTSQVSNVAIAEDRESQITLLMNSGMSRTLATQMLDERTASGKETGLPKKDPEGYLIPQSEFVKNF